MASYDSLHFMIVLIIYIPLTILTTVIVIRALARNPRNRLNQIFSLLFISYNLGFIFWFSYDFISEPSQLPLAYVLDGLGYFFWVYGTGFLVLYILIIYKPKVMNKNMNQVLFLGIYGLFTGVLFMVPSEITIILLEDGRITRPAWSLALSAYYISLFLVFSVISVIIGLKTLETFENPKLKKKMACFILGLILYYFVMMDTAYMRWLDIPMVRNVLSIVNSIILVSSFLMYLAIGTPMREDSPQ